MAEVFIDNAKVMAKGQVTIPKKIRDILEIENGDYVTFIVDEWKIQIVNSKTFIEDNIQSRK
ncbi:AbrB/MazE/SpoVT family DNA-binding domain-containing protein [Peptostreptococcaceae bacterium oral taxon 081]|nr:AbrB/MazE/SpoVT family DNA-binding domain-containing protein [Peptostreptococcaceae bacterium oral taxon 081]